MKGYCSKCKLQLVRGECSVTVYTKQRGYCRKCDAVQAKKRYYDVRKSYLEICNT